MSNVKSALTRKFGPLPAWAWFAILFIGVFYYRKRMSGAASATGTGTGSVTPGPGPAPGTGEQVLQPGESIYDPTAGTLETAPGGGNAASPGTTTPIPDAPPLGNGNGDTPGNPSTAATPNHKGKGKRKIKPKPGKGKGKNLLNRNKKPKTVRSHAGVRNHNGGRTVQHKGHHPSGGAALSKGRHTSRSDKQAMTNQQQTYRIRSVASDAARNTPSRGRSRPTVPAISHTVNQRPVASHTPQARPSAAAAPRPSAPPPRKANRTGRKKK